ncbi:hypothetical protein [Oceanirhabdus sp. W0125-5]|uniref:hypothetical protein n=1 Tax=Oceanirhabdus sp. W0125-5 TaxID=2999116 RepID=UPI0022F2E449|nr:hypothetical protein [Oceanirhabdus sp. W0125-5]WBW98843.1 hypothetical protein OW730_08905 [Oceanirhabdus sp. W0125-5]
MLINEKQLKGYLNLLNSKNQNDVTLAWEYLMNSNYKLIISLDDIEYKIQYLGKDKLIKEIGEYLIPYFESDNLFFLDDKLFKRMLKGKQIKVPLDYSIMFDTNFASYISRFVKGKLNEIDNNSVYTVIDKLIKNQFNFDYQFYLLENSKTIGNKESERIVLESLKDLELFKSIDSDEYRKSGNVNYTISEEVAYKNASKIFYSLYGSQMGENILNVIKERLNNCILFLIGMYKIQFQSKKSAKNKMIELKKYINEVLGVYLERESIMAYEYFDKNRELTIFNKLTKGNKNLDREKLIAIIENTAWDLLVPRVMEISISAFSREVFFIPYFLTFDQGLKKYFNLINAKGILFKKDTINYTPFYSKKSQDYFKEKNIDLRDLFSEENREKRYRIHEKNLRNYQEVVSKELDELWNIINTNN